MPSPGSGSSYTSVSLTNNDDINSLISGNRWASDVITYSFPWSNGSSDFSNNYSGYNEHEADERFEFSSLVQQAPSDAPMFVNA
jgi:hypothetical protein